jgi:hypothetical protein
MGITPDMSKPKKTASIRNVAHILIFCRRAQKQAEAWRENRKIHEAIVKKLETMRGRRRGTALR